MVVIIIYDIYFVVSNEVFVVSHFRLFLVFILFLIFLIAKYFHEKLAMNMLLWTLNVASAFLALSDYSLFIGIEIFILLHNYIIQCLGK